MARRRKVYDPAAATVASLERRDREAEKRRLEAMGAKVQTDRGGRILSAYRSNVFNLLLTRGSITPNHHDAAHRLSLDWAAWKGLDGKPETFGEVVDGGCGAAELVTDRMIRAGRDVNRALVAMEPLSRVILERFMVATVEEDRPMAWRGVMERIGIKARERQTLLVVAALEELRAFYQEPGRVAA
jgi:hypothetical protein